MVTKRLFKLFSKESDSKEDDRAVDKSASREVKVVAASQVGSKLIRKQEDRREPVDPALLQEMSEYARDALQSILQKATFSCTVSYVDSDDTVRLEIEDSEDMGRVIGKDGATIDALHLLIRAMMFQKFDQRVPLQIDAGDYNQKKREQILARVTQVVDDIKAGREECVSLEPMSASSRRAIHLQLENEPAVKTYSEGGGRFRKLVIERND